MAYNYTYDPEADVLAMTIHDRPYDHTVEMGDFIVHVDTKDKPVYIEVLNARQFLQHATQTLPPKIKDALFQTTQLT